MRQAASAIVPAILLVALLARDAVSGRPPGLVIAELLAAIPVASFSGARPRTPGRRSSRPIATGRAVPGRSNERSFGCALVLRALLRQLPVQRQQGRGVQEGLCSRRQVGGSVGGGVGRWNHRERREVFVTAFMRAGVAVRVTASIGSPYKCAAADNPARWAQHVDRLGCDQIR